MEIIGRWFKTNPEDLRLFLQKRAQNRSSSTCLFSQLLYGEGIELGTEDMTNGKFCFYGSLLLSLCLGSSLPYQPLFSYSLLYVLIDSFLDKPKSDRLPDILCHLYALLEGESPPPEDAFLSLVSKHYARLIQYRPAIREDLVKIFLIELESVPFQSNPEHTEEEFMHMCKRKGALSLHALFTLNGKQDLATSEEIGFCIQLLDDLYDVFLDKEENIYTIATHHLYKRSNCDDLYLFTLQRIDRLPAEFILLQTVMMSFALCLAQNVPCLSPGLKAELQAFFFLPPGVQLSQVL